MIARFELEHQTKPLWKHPIFCYIAYIIILTATRQCAIMSGNIGPVLLGIQWSLWIVSTAVMSMRVYVRTSYLKSRLNAADWTMIVALVCGSCYTSIHAR